MATRRLVVASVLAGLAGMSSLPGQAMAQRRDPGVSGPVSGTLTLRAQGAAAGIGYTWGDGTLRYGSRSYRFSVNGINVADIGYSKVSGRGRVYNLHRLQDFSGTYAAATGQATVGSGIGGQVLRNANGVEIRIDQTTRGARLEGSVDGIKLALR